jgi:hypothetical protein
VVEELTNESGQAARAEHVRGALELAGRPPSQPAHVLGGQVEPWDRLEGLDANEVAPLSLPAEANRMFELVLARPQAWAELELVEAELLGQFAPERVLV